jgi:hypothetical protein
MILGNVVFQPRIQAHLMAAKVEQAQLKNVVRCPNVLRMFHLITSHALQVLDRDPALLEKLEANFSGSRMLSKDLGRDLEGKGLILNIFGDSDNPIFYSLSGTSQAELRVIDEMGQDFAQNPTLPDIGICFEALFGVTVTSGGKLSRHQLTVFNQIFDPRGDAIPLLIKRGIGRICITHINEEGIQIVTEEKTGEKILSIPARSLCEDISNVRPFVIGALA